MARQSLDSLLGNTAIDDTPASQSTTKHNLPAVSQPQEQPSEQEKSPKVPKARRVPNPPTEEPAPEASEAKYLTLIRKETRIREEQYANLTDKSRQLNRAKRGGERITENTLIRVAIDLLWAQAGNLEGVNEAQLRKSVGL